MIKRLNNAKRQTNYLVCNIEVVNEAVECGGLEELERLIRTNFEKNRK